MDKRYRIVDGLTANDVACMPFGEIWKRLMQMGRDRDTARASEAMLRGTLADINAYLNDPETTIAQGDQIENVLNSIDTALSTTSGEWLERHDAEHDAAEFQRGWRCGVAAITEEKAAEIERSYGIIRGQTEELAAAVAARDSYRALVDAGTAACAEVDARCAALQEKCDGLAEQLHNVRDGLLAYFSGSFLDNNIFTDEYKVTLAARDTRIAAEAISGEKETRIKYQDIAYAVCNFIDSTVGRKGGTGVLADKDEILIHLARITAEARRKALMEVAEAALEKYGASPTQHWLAKMAQEADHA